jgi:tetratricopeptide (TPR) repeat protein
MKINIKYPNFTKRTKYIILSCVLLLVVLVIFFIISFISVNNTQKLVPVNASYAKIFNNTVTDAINQSNLGNYDRAIVELKSAKPLNNSETFSVNNYLGLIYYTKGQYSEALSYYLAAYKVDPRLSSDSDLAIIARLYVKENNKTMAIAFYKKAIVLIQTPKYSFDGYRVSSYQATIKSLEQK